MDTQMFPGGYDSFRHMFSRSTGTQWVHGRHIQLPEGRGWLMNMGPDWWLITGDPSVTPTNVKGVAINPRASAVFVVRWGTAHLRVWRCHVYEKQLFPKPRSIRAYFPRAILPPPVNRRRNGPWSNELWVVQ